MMITALLLRGWVVQMKELGIHPRVLADDIQIVAVGEDHLEKLVRAMDDTHVYLQSMGAKTAPTKSRTFSTEKESREWLERHKWRAIGTKICWPVWQKNAPAATMPRCLLRVCFSSVANLPVESGCTENRMESHGHP